MTWCVRIWSLHHEEVTVAVEEPVVDHEHAPVDDRCEREVFERLAEGTVKTSDVGLGVGQREARHAA